VPGLELVPLPVRVVEVLVENDHGADRNAIRDPVEDIDGRRVEVAVDMNERDRPRMFTAPDRQRVAEQPL